VGKIQKGHSLMSNTAAIATGVVPHALVWANPHDYLLRADSSLLGIRPISLVGYVSITMILLQSVFNVPLPGEFRGHIIYFMQPTYTVSEVNHMPPDMSIVKVLCPLPRNTPYTTR